MKSIVARTGQASDADERCSQQLLVTSLLIALSCPVQAICLQAILSKAFVSRQSCPRHLPPDNPSQALASRRNPVLRTDDGIEGRGHCDACDDRVRPASRPVQGRDSEIHRQRAGQRGGGNFHLYNNHSGNNNNHCSQGPYYSSSCSSG